MATVSWMAAGRRNDDQNTLSPSGGSHVQSTAVAGPIAVTTLKAKQLFESCLESDNITFKETAEAQLSRFSLWYSNIGVFAAVHASLDYRLRTSAEARSAVEGNLDILCEQLIYALTGSDDHVEQIMEADPYKITKITSLWHQARDGLTHLIKTTSTITTLHRLSLTIRKSSNRNTLAKLPRLLDYDEDYQIFRKGTWPFDVEGREEAPACRFDTTTAFGDYVREVLTSRWMRLFPSKDASTEHRKHIQTYDGLSEVQRAYRQVVFDRCVAAITARRRQLTYFRRHQSKLSTMAELPFFRPGLAQNLVPALETQRISPGDMSLQANDNYLDPASGNLGVSYTISDTAPSLLLSASFRLSRVNAPPSTVASSEEDITQSLGGVFDIPPPPKLDLSDQEKECPYCCLVYARATFEAVHTRRWRKHLVEDIQPYVCVFRNCDQAGKSYHSFKEWQAHLEKTHYQDWQLTDDPSSNSASEFRTTFDDMRAFHAHLNEVYPDLDKSAARSMAYAAGQPTTLPSWCFVCLEPHEGPSLLKHVFIHLKQAFLLALPARDDLDEMDAVSSGRSSVQTAAARSALVGNEGSTRSTNSNGVPMNPPFETVPLARAPRRRNNSPGSATRLSPPRASQDPLIEKVGRQYVDEERLWAGKSSTDEDSLASIATTPPLDTASVRARRQARLASRGDEAEAEAVWDAGFQGVGIHGVSAVSTSPKRSSVTESALLTDQRAMHIKPDSPEGWRRKAAARHRQGDLFGATDAYQEALVLNPDDAHAKAGLQSVVDFMFAPPGGGGPIGGLGDMFKDPQLIQKLARHPRTATLLDDQQFMQKLVKVKDNPEDLTAEMNDPRMLQVISVLMKLDIDMSGDPHGRAEQDSGSPEEGTQNAAALSEHRMLTGRAQESGLATALENAIKKRASEQVESIPAQKVTSHDKEQFQEKNRMGTRAARFEEEKGRIIESLFSKTDAGGALAESYITHVRTLEDALLPGTPFNPSSETANKHRILIMSVVKNGRVRLHKAKENPNSTFSIGKTWRMDDLRSLQSWKFYEPQNSQEMQWKAWAGGCGFTMTITKPYYWQAQTEKEKSFWLLAVAKVYRKYTGGRMPEMIGFSSAELGSLPAG